MKLVWTREQDMAHDFFRAGGASLFGMTAADFFRARFPVVYVETHEEDRVLRELQASLTDPNFRIFADRAAITVLNNERFVRGTDIQDIFDQLDVDDPSHAFYLGKELARARLAVTVFRPAGRSTVTAITV